MLPHWGYWWVRLLLLALTQVTCIFYNKHHSAVCSSLESLSCAPIRLSSCCLLCLFITCVFSIFSPYVSATWPYCYRLLVIIKGLHMWRSVYTLFYDYWHLSKLPHQFIILIEGIEGYSCRTSSFHLNTTLTSHMSIDSY